MSRPLSLIVAALGATLAASAVSSQLDPAAVRSMGELMTEGLASVAESLDAIGAEQGGQLADALAAAHAEADELRAKLDGQALQLANMATELQGAQQALSDLLAGINAAPSGPAAL